ncbi:MAG: GxxExxY protein [Verrucomicrobiales bacterium]|nr:GxxExxY protein [Verrucomicrobiales bacterium]
MTENEIAKIVVNSSVSIHRSLGPGLFESVYQRVLAYELRKAGLKVETETPVPLEWDGNILDESFRADMIVEGKLLLELKSLEKLTPVHKKQVLTYLRLLDLRLGLLLNFGAELMKEGTHRIANGIED